MSQGHQLNSSGNDLELADMEREAQRLRSSGMRILFVAAMVCSAVLLTGFLDPEALYYTRGIGLWASIALAFVVAAGLVIYGLSTHVKKKLERVRANRAAKAR